MHDDGQGDFRSLPRRVGGLLRGRTRNVSLLLGLALWVAFVSSQNEHFLTEASARVVGLNMAFTAIAAIGTAVLIISGSIDLSVGSVFALTAIVAADVSSAVPSWLAFLIGIGAGLAVCAVNGLLCWVIPISPIVITLGSLALIRGAVSVWTKNAPVSDAAADFSDLARSTPFGVPTPVIVMLIAVTVTALVMSTTTIGRHLYAIGGNRQACAAAGLPVRRLVIGSFAFGGAMVGLAGILAAGRYGAPDSTYGVGFELIVITGVLLGGVSFAGGEGSVQGAVLGVFALTIIDSGIVAIGLNPYYSDVVQGTLLILAVGADQVAHRQRERFQKAIGMRDQQLRQSADDHEAEGLHDLLRKASSNP